MMSTRCKTILLAMTLAVLGPATLSMEGLGGRLAAAHDGEQGKKDGAGKETPAPEEPTELRVLYSPDGSPLPDRIMQPINFSGVDDPKCTLAEFIHEYEKRYDVRMLVNRKAFAKENIVDVEKFEFANPHPVSARPRVNLRQVLNWVLERIPVESGAMYVIRSNYLEITTRAAVRAELGREEEDPLPPLVYAGVQKQPLVKILEALAQQTGANLVLDQRVADRAKIPISAEFRNVPLDNVVRVLADMCDLKPVQLDNMIYITSPENAQRFQKDSRQRTEKEKDQTDTPFEMLAGNWQIDYTNGAVRHYVIDKDGKVSGTADEERLKGRIKRMGDTLILIFAGDGKLEKLTLGADGRLFVDHYTDKDDYPAQKAPITGIGVRLK